MQSKGLSRVFSTLTFAVLLLTILSLILYRQSSQVFSRDPVLTTVAVLLLLLTIGVTSSGGSPRTPLVFHSG